MRILKFLIGLILLLFLIVLIGGLLMPKQMKIKKEVSINVPATEAFNQINQLRQWNNWSPWYGLDPDTKWAYSNPDSGKNSWYTWKSEDKNVGNGKLTLTDVVPNKKISSKIEFEGMGDALTNFYFDESGGKTTVTWDFESEIGSNPIARFFANTMGVRTLGGQYQQGLDKLKKHLENS